MKLYHGTSKAAYEKISGAKEGLKAVDRGFVHLTDSFDAALDYAQSRASSDKSDPVVLAVTLPDFQWQPNGTPAPPFSEDSWHRDSGMPGEAWVYDADIAYNKIIVVQGRQS